MWLNRYIKFLAVATFCLLIAGGLVTSNDYGLAVPDWPKSYGMWMPPMIGGVLYEHGHRMIASFVGLLTVILAVWLWLKEDRRWVRLLGLTALIAVIVQGALGGITVLYLLPTPISVLHATLAQTFFSLIVSLVLFTSPRWRTAPTPIPANDTGAIRLLILTTVAIYAQLILGSWMRHSEAALAIPDFPLAFGRVIPPFRSPEIVIHFAHRIGALVVFVFISMSVLVTFRNFRKENWLLRPAVLLLALVFVQILLGAYTVWTRTSVFFATAHVATGASLLATSVVLALRTYRLVARPGRSSDAIPASTVASIA